MALAINFYKQKKYDCFKDSEETVKFTIKMNDLFDALNRRYPKEGIRKNSSDIQVLHESLNWLNEWETNLSNGSIKGCHFLTQSTFDGLKITVKSTIDLVEYLLEKCGFSYVLTAEFNQDSLEKFFGIIRQVAGPNDHPTTPTSLQLYRMLSVYSVVKPPKTGNCTVNEEAIPIISIQDLIEIMNEPSNAPERQNKINKLKERIDKIIQDECWDLDDFLLDHNYAYSTVFDCIVYFLAGYIARRLVKITKFDMCIESLKCLNTSEGQIDKEADLVQAKTKGYLTYPDSNLYKIIKQLEECFALNASSNDVFENTCNEFFTRNLNIKFNCTIREHQKEMLTNIVSYYITMRMRQYTFMQNQANKKQCQTKKSYQN